MSYHLLFALNLEQQGSQIFYDPKEFVDDAVVISVPDVKELVNSFVKNLELVAVVERETKRNAQESKELKAGSNRTELSDNNLLSSEKKTGQTTVLLRPVAAEAYVGKAKKLDISSLERLCSEATAYLTTSFSKIAGADFLSNELDVVFAGIREINDLRNYLLTFVKNPTKKKIYLEGYIYVMVV